MKPGNVVPGDYILFRDVHRGRGLGSAEGIFLGAPGSFSPIFLMPAPASMLCCPRIIIFLEINLASDYF